MLLFYLLASVTLVLLYIFSVSVTNLLNYFNICPPPLECKLQENSVFALFRVQVSTASGLLQVLPAYLLGEGMGV